MRASSCPHFIFARGPVALIAPCPKVRLGSVCQKYLPRGFEVGTGLVRVTAREMARSILERHSGRLECREPAPPRVWASRQSRTSLPFKPAQASSGESRTMDLNPDDTVYPIAKIALVLDALAAEGVPKEDALRRVRLSEASISSPATRVSLNQVIDCCSYAAERSHDPHFAYHTGCGFTS